MTEKIIDPAKRARSIALLELTIAKHDYIIRICRQTLQAMEEKQVCRLGELRFQKLLQKCIADRAAKAAANQPLQ